MPLPDPRPGLVIRYDYLWSDEADAGRNQGKDRPVCLLVAGPATADPRYIVLLPITHTPPSGGTLGIELPLKVKRVLGMDDDPSWVIVSESNVDVWPTAGISMVPGRPGEFTYGFLPPGLFQLIKAKFLDVARRNDGSFIRR